VLPERSAALDSLDRDELRAAIEASGAVLGMNGHVRFRVGVADGELKIHSSLSDTGESEESIPTEYEGPAVEIGFNAGYLMEFLASAAGAEGVVPLQDPK